MSGSRINLSRLRQAFPMTNGGLAAPPADAAFTRRQFLGLAGAGAVGASPILLAGQAAWLGPFELAHTPGRAAFTLGGRECWVVDVRDFAGVPALSVERDEGEIRLALTGAHYPGSAVRADLFCVLRRGPAGWRMVLTVPACGLRGRARFERWLAGLEAVTAVGKCPRVLACALGPGSDLTLSGRVTAAYRPDGTVHLSGDRVALLRHGGAEFTADSCEIAPVAPDVPGLRRGAAPRRTAFRLERGAHCWPLAPLLPPAPAGTVSGEGVFDILAVEAGEGRGGGPRHALLACADAPGASLAFHLDGLAALRLYAPRAAVAFSASGNHHTALVAEHAPDPAWLRLGGTDVQVGHPGGEARFALTGRGVRLTGLDCAPTLLGAAVPMPGAAVEPVRFRSAPRLRVTLDGVGAAPSEYDSGHDSGQPPVQEAALRVSRAGAAPLALPPDMSVSVLRPDDLLALRFEFVNLAFDSNRTHLVAAPSSPGSAYIVVHFPPQSVAEQVYPEGTSPGTALALSSVAGESRLAFVVAPDALPLAYTLPSLLTAISQATMSVLPNASAPGVLPDGFPGPRSFFHEGSAPSDPDQSSTPVTAIEMPWRLVLSPSAATAYQGPRQAWVHATGEPVTHGGRTELWHTRLAVSTSAGPDETDPRFARTIWSPDYTPNGVYDPFLTALTSNDRRQLVGLMANFTSFLATTVGGGGLFYLSNGTENRYMTVDRMMLSALGGWLNSRYDGGTVSGYSITDWNHRAAVGRDTYVRVVYAGTLFPLGHPASLIKVTERKFYRDPATLEYRADLFQRTYIVVRQPVMTYTDVRMPFRTVQITTLTTPNLASTDPTSAAYNFHSTIGAFGQDAFWPVILATGQDFRFHVVATDFEGQQTEFSLPLIFVEANTGLDAGSIAYSTANGYYVAVDGAGQIRRSISMGGQTVAFAPTAAAVPGAISPHAATPGATSFPAQAVAFAADIGDGPAFAPVFGAATIRLPAVEQIAGGVKEAVVAFHPTYITDGFGGANAGQVFLHVIQDPLKALPTDPYDPSNLATTALGFAADKSGGLATPDLGISGLSRVLGPVGGDLDPANLASSILSGHFDPAQYFDFASAKLLGAIPLGDLLQAVTDLTQTPKLVSQKLPDSLVSTLNWDTTALNSLPLFKPGPDTHLTLAATVTQQIPKSGGPVAPPTYDVLGTLNDFTLDMFGFIGLTFTAVTFHAGAGQKLTVSPDIANVDFEGPLKFVDQLRQLIPSGGLDPANLDVSPTGVTASLALTIPSGGVGIFSLENIRFAAGLTIPFTGQPVRLRLGFSSREDPFLVTVSLIAGGGYFTLALGADGVEMLEAGIDLGGNISLDLVVVSANVHVLLGLSFLWDNAKNAATVSGYLNVGGSVDLLGLITVSVQFMISLSYTTNGTIAGEASLTVEIDILFFSKSITLTVHREFHSDALNISGLAVLGHAAPRLIAGPPRFVDVVPTQDVWNAYAAAFAA